MAADTFDLLPYVPGVCGPRARGLAMDADDTMLQYMLAAAAALAMLCDVLAMCSASPRAP